MGNRYTHPMEITTKLALIVSRWPEPQYVIAANCGVSPSRLSEFINGRRQLKPNHIVAFSNYFQVPAKDLIGDLRPEDFAEVEAD